jgi:outer membrane protein assembly factor BamB
MQEFKQSDAAWRFTAWVAGVFTVLLGGAMILSHFGGKDRDPWRSPQLLAQKEQLRASPKDEAVKQRIRDLDLSLRQRYFRQLSRMNTGVYLVLGGAALFGWACARVLRGQKNLPALQVKPDANAMMKTAGFSRWAVGATGAVAGGLLFLAGLGFTTALPANTAQIDKLLSGEAEAAPAPDAASLAELAANWPRFLGANAGWAAASSAPTNWDAASGANIAWKTPAPGQGFNSPLVWGNRLFLSGGNEALREVYCLNTATGALLWRQAITNVPGAAAKPPEIPESTGYAAPTMATDGRRVYVMYANGDLAGLSLEGRLLWARGFGALKNAYGHANSLSTWRDRVIVQLDQGEAEENLSKLYAIDGRTGKVIWQQARKVGASWASPLTFEFNGKGQIVCLSLPHAIAYNADTGAELWRVDCLNGEVTPSPVYSSGYVLVASPSDKLVAIRPDGQGDVTKTHVAWTSEDNVPDVTSPAATSNYVFTLSTSGMLTCFNLPDGKKLWEHDFEEECHASPAVAGNHVYLLTQKGNAFVVAAAPEFREVFRAALGDSFHASPAIAADRVYLRGVSNLWCLASASAKPAEPRK